MCAHIHTYTAKKKESTVIGENYVNEEKRQLVHLGTFIFNIRFILDTAFILRDTFMEFYKPCMLV